MSYQIRPRFNIETDRSPDVLIDLISKNLDKDGAICRGKIRGEFVTLYVHPEDQHYWSPQLTLTIDHDDNSTTIRGLFGPRPEVWTMFVFFYFIIALLVVIVLVIGFAGMSLGDSGIILWALPFLSAIMISLYFTSSYGQKLGHNQMTILKQFFEEATQLKI